MAGALVLASLVLLALPEERQEGLAQVLHQGLQWPFAGLRAATAGYLGLRGENERLRLELQEARLQLAGSAAERAENRQLRRLLAFGESQPVALVPARVIDRDFETLPTAFMIDVGARDGIVENLPVVTDQGLVGKTVHVGARTTRVMLYHHPDFSASALLLGRDQVEYGVVRPGERGELHLVLPLRSASKAGNRIVTSGYGGTFPRGIPVGTVAEVREDRQLGLQRIDVVRPLADLGSTGAVLVLLRRPAPERAAGDELRLFWPGYEAPAMTGEPLPAAADSLPAAADSLPAEGGP